MTQNPPFIPKLLICPDVSHERLEFHVKMWFKRKEILNKIGVYSEITDCLKCNESFDSPQKLYMHLYIWLKDHCILEEFKEIISKNQWDAEKWDKIRRKMRSIHIDSLGPCSNFDLPGYYKGPNVSLKNTIDTLLDDPHL